jgi:hypothetical protein
MEIVFYWTLPLASSLFPTEKTRGNFNLFKSGVIALNHEQPLKKQLRRWLQRNKIYHGQL